MKFLGSNNAYFETKTITLADKDLIENSQHSDLLLLCFEEDGNSFTIDNTDYTFNKNELVCLTEFHKVEVNNITGARLIKWNKHFYCIINHDSAVGCKGILFYGAVCLPIIRPEPQDMESIKLVWRLLEQEMKSNDILQEEMLQMTLKRLLVLCVRTYRNQTDFKHVDEENSDVIREYHFLVEKFFKRKHKVADYAELMAKSPKTLSNAFKKLGSKSPLQFIKDRKMLEAKRLLAYSDMSASQVGYELGFSDIQSFSRFFKREAGVSPLQFKD